MLVLKVVISLGGSLVFRKEGIAVDYLKRFSEMITSFENASIALTVGGGRIAREYVEKGRMLGANNFELDEISIQLVKANSRLVCSAIPPAVFFEDFEEAARMFSKQPSIIVLGVGTPGQTSDSTSALFAEETEADRWVNLTNVDGVYDKDPKKYDDAVKFSEMTHAELLELVEKYDKRKSGENFVIDVLAAKVLARSNIEAHVVNGDDLEQAHKAILGLKHNGTVVKD